MRTQNVNILEWTKKKLKEIQNGLRLSKILKRNSIVIVIVIRPLTKEFCENLDRKKW